MTPLQLRVLLLCFLLYMLDGADVLVVSYAAPDIAAEWNVSAEKLGLLFSAGLAGMTLGALGLAPISDRVGRRVITLLAIVIISVGMVASAFAPNLDSLMILRLFVGLGIGSMLASMTALGAEFAPPRFRAFAVTFATAGYPLGAVLTGIAAAYVLPRFGWEGLFVGAGLLSVIVLPVCAVFLPESIAYLGERQPRGALGKINAMRGAMGLATLDALPPPAERASGVSVHQVLVPSLRRSTFMIWGAFFATFMTLYFLTSWIPKIAVDAGLPVTDAIYAGATFNLGALVGVILLGWMTTNTSLTGLIVVFFIGGPASMLLFGYLHSPLWLAFAEIFAMGFFIQGGFSGLYAVAARTYPTIIRTTGVGWGLGAGRLGAVFGPYLGGLALGAGVSLQTCFLIFAVPIGLAGLFVWRLGEPVGAKVLKTL